MCGIVVAAGQLAYKQEQAFKNLLILDALRGIDSTGIASIGRQALPPVVAKQVGNPYDLLETTTAEKIFRRANNVLIGHNRFATQGTVNRKNAHPFEFDNLVGVHNGTLTNKYQLPNGIDYSVDSQALYACMNEKGVRATLDIIQGAWSLVWYDYNKHTLNFLRNKERPMFIAYDKVTNALYAASEKWMLHIATSRQQVDIADPFATDEDVHYEFKIDPDGKVNEPVLTEMKAKEAVVYYGGFRQQEQRSLSLVSAHAQPEAKKAGVVPPSPDGANEPDPGYVGKEGVILRIMAAGVDEYGARFFMCHDAAHPGRLIRMFLSRHDRPESYIDKHITATIGKYYKTSGRNRQGYYKVDYGSVKLYRPIAAAIHLDDEVEEDVPELFPAASGTMLDKKAWQNEHGTCAWCTTEIDPEHNAHRFTSSGDVLCGDCANDPEVKDYVKLM